MLLIIVSLLLNKWLRDHLTSPNHFHHDFRLKTKSLVATSSWNLQNQGKWEHFSIPSDLTQDFEKVTFPIIAPSSRNRLLIKVKIAPVDHDHWFEHFDRIQQSLIRMKNYFFFA